MSTIAAPHRIAFGALGGIAGGLVAASSVLAQPFLYLISPFPIAAAALGYGVAGAVAAVIATFVVTAILIGSFSALTVTLLIAIPSAIGGTMAALARPADEVGGPAGHLLWFPISDILAVLGLCAAISYLILISVVGTDTDIATQIAEQLVSALREANPQLDLPPDFEATLATSLDTLIPIVQPASWTMVLLLNLSLAIRLVRRGGLLDRPRESWASILRMPRLSLPVFLVAIALSFTSGPLRLIGLALCGGLGAGFLLAGFGLLHEKSRTLGAMRPLVIAGAYFLVFVFVPAALAFVIAGLFRTGRAAPMSPTGGPNPPPTNPPNP